MNMTKSSLRLSLEDFLSDEIGDLFDDDEQVVELVDSFLERLDEEGAFCADGVEE